MNVAPTREHVYQIFILCSCFTRLKEVYYAANIGLTQLTEDF
jgi:hypothetical protein